jgi:hypothetical protein
MAAINELTISELVEHTCGTSNAPRIMQVDCAAPRALIDGLAVWHRHAAFLQTSWFKSICPLNCPVAPAQWFLPVVDNLPNRRGHSAISSPSCQACLVDHEERDTSPYWKVDWAIALITACPDLTF